MQLAALSDMQLEVVAIILMPRMCGLCAAAGHRRDLGANMHKHKHKHSIELDLQLETLMSC